MRLQLVDRRRDAAWRPATDLWDILQTVGEPAGRPDWPLDWVLVDDDQMAGLNARYRGVDGITDVLSFSYLSTAGAGRPQLAGGRFHAAGDLWRDPVEAAAGSAVGEVVLAPAFVTARCREQGWSLVHELALLTAHGILHVLGWEHGDEAAARTMRVHEAELLRQAGLAHPMLEGGRNTDGE
jgi:probable rRNA maturation factor